MCDALKNKDKYDKRKAKVERLTVRQAVVTILDGPARGEKSKVDYKAPGKVDKDGHPMAAGDTVMCHARKH